MSLNRVVNRGNLSVCSYAYGNPVVLKEDSNDYLGREYN